MVIEKKSISGDYPTGTLQDVFSSSKDCIILTDSKGIINSVNKTTINLLGYKINEIKGIHLLNLLEFDLNKNDLEKITIENDFNNVHCQLLDKNGRSIPITLSKHILKSDNEEKIDTIYIAKNLKTSKSFERILQDSFLFDSFMNNMPVSIYFKDKKGRHVRISKFGFDSMDVLGKTDAEIYYEEEYTKAMETDKKVMETKQAIIEDEEFCIHTDTKDPLFYLTIKAPIIDEQGTVLGVMGFSHNITENTYIAQKRYELELRRNKFISMASHELRTPLTAIRGFSEFLEKYHNKLDQGRINISFQMIRKNVIRLEQLIKGVNQISQMESGIFRLNPIITNLETIVSDVILEYQIILTDQIELHKAPNRSTVAIEADLDRIHQVLVNLIDNAIKHTDDNKRKIIVSELIFPDNVEIRITDNGAGISPKNIDLIFNQFVTIPTKYSTQGSGIGLYISRMIIASHGGTLTVNSEGVGKGATFIISLPRIIIDNQDKVS